MHKTELHKQNLRRQMRALRASITPVKRKEASGQIENRLREFCLEQDWRQVAVYLATDEEVDLDGFIFWLLERDTTIYAPRDDGFAPLDNLKNVKVGNFNVREPQNAVALPPPETVFLVPGLAFDRNGGRLGFGGGWYDRALARFPQSLKIGVAFDCQIVDEVPCEAHDVKMDVIVTPSLRDEG